MSDVEIRPSSPLRVKVDAVPSSTRFLSELIWIYLTQVLGLDPEQPDTVRTRLAVVEAINNVIDHGYAGREPGPITVSMERDGEWLVARIDDEAPKFDPHESYGNLPRPELLQKNGYGLGIIREVVDEMEHGYVEGTGNRLTLRKKLWT